MSLPNQPVPSEWIDEIPTNPSVFKARVIAIAALVLAGLGLAAWSWGPPALDAFLARHFEVSKLLEGNGSSRALRLCFQFFGAAGGLCLLAGMAGLLRNRISYQALRAALAIQCVAVAAYVYAAWMAAWSILGAGLDLNGNKQDSATILLFIWDVAWPALAAALYAAWLLVMLRSRSVHAAFTGETGGPLGGDYMLENLRSHGRDPRHRRSIYASAITHVVVIILIPWVLGLGGCVTAYRVPAGSGNPVVAVVKMTKPQKKKKKTLRLRPNSDIIFEMPDLDDTEIDRKMEEQTENKYVAAAGAKPGKMGKGGGSKGGWPEGMEDYQIRFIRLEHSGLGWDDGMDAQTGADINFLRSFAQATGFKKIASKGESHSIALLRKYPDDGFPPFVFLTGNDSIGQVSPADAKTLREYCLKGGMLIGDAGSPRFHQSFLQVMRQVFPDKPLIDIADDDVLYQLPYSFPDGAPAFWHHGGRRALGVKHEGRWVVFYHPGDMNDAWKSPGFTDVTPEMREAAMNLGINLVYYSFSQWNDAITRRRK